jgi:hypothetical protein
VAAARSQPKIDPSKVVKETAPLDELVTGNLEEERSRFNLTEEQWQEIGDGRMFSRRRGLFRRRRSTAA